MQVGCQARPRARIGEHAGEAADTALMVAEPYGRRRTQDPIIDVLRIELQQPVELLDGFGVLVAVEEHAGVVPTATSTDRKSTRLNSSHLVISYAVLCLKKK